MTSADPRRLAPLLLLLAACGSGKSTTPDPGVIGGDLPNVMALSVNGAGCSADSYLNKPCVSVKLCLPGTQTCQVVDDLLLDTGSTGLRVFAEVVSGLGLPRVTAGGQTVAECIGYLDGSNQWGPLATADVVLASEPAVTIPIQLIDDAFVPGRSQCTGAEKLADAGFNGILGVSNWKEDCGASCTSSASNGMYYACGDASCAGTTRPLAGQLQNPVAALPLDNNGVVVKLPAVGALGSPSVEGTLLLGIGTRSNNARPPAATLIQLDSSGEFKTAVSGAAKRAFTDTGSNGLFFTPPVSAGLTTCAAYADWFCPDSTLSLTATNSAASGLAGGSIGFEIGSFKSIMIDQPAVYVSPAVGGPLATYFDWGLPFFLGRDVYLGLESSSSNGFVAY